MNLLKALVRTGGAGIEAQLVELDIVVSAKSIEDLAAEIAYVLTLEYKIALENGLTPFASLAKQAAHELESEWTEASKDGMRLHPLQIPTEVLRALSIALHTTRVCQFALQHITVTMAA